MTLSNNWLFDTTRKDPRVLEHLAAENRVTDEALSALKPLQAELVEEMKVRDSVDHISAEVRDGDFFYYTELTADASQTRHLRRHADSGIVEVLLDEEIEARGGYYAVGELEVSDDHTRLAWTEDRDGSEDYTLIVKDIATGAELGRVDNVTDTFVFSTDGEQVAFLRTDDADRPCELWALHIATGETSLIFREEDEAKHVSIDITRDDKWVTITGYGIETTTSYVLDRANLMNVIEFTPTIEGIKVSIDAYDGFFWIHSDHEANDGGIYVGQIGQTHNEWATVLAPTLGLRYEAIALFDTFVAIEARINGFTRTAVAKRDGITVGALHWIGDLNTPSTTVIDENPMPEAQELRVEVTTWTEPDATWLYPVNTDGSLGEGILEVQDIVPSYNANDYEAELLWATSHDGVRVPVSVIRRKDTEILGTQLWAYGAYGASEDPGFVSSWVSFLDRGIACAVAHVRGGGEMGRDWYDNGRMENKVNTFHDTIAAAHELTAIGYCPNGNLVLRGGSAGGLLVGATINMAPELFRGAVAQVPFVDCVTTLNDPTLPFTIYEYNEWGNPNDPEALARIQAYSPIDNVTRQGYPAILATAGLHDPRVGYWEPAKWVLALRENTTSGNPVLLRVNMNGHGCSTNRWEYFEEAAETMSFVLDCLGVTAAKEVAAVA